jgi:EAL domain
VATERFLRLAEETGLILPLTLRVLYLALDQQRIWRSDGRDLAVAINLANSCLQNPQFPNILTHILRTASGQPDGLVFEITESALASNPARVLETLQRLASLGCQLVGTGRPRARGCGRGNAAAAQCSLSCGRVRRCKRLASAINVTSLSPCSETWCFL